MKGLSLAARERIAQARLVVGGARHLQLIGETAGERLAWPSPLQEAFPKILARRGEPVVVLASGDPFFFGVGSLLAQIVPPAEILCLPQPSAFSLAASRLGWALQDCALVTLHGRALEKIISHLQPGAKILALSWDGETPGKLAALLRERGLGASKLTVCEAMGGPRELLRTAPADGFDIQGIDPLNTIALEVLGDGVRIPPKTPGLPDDWFEHDGQITKREMRALTLSQLAPRPRDLLWDVGAGSGSISIEWLLSDPSTRALAIEKNPERCARIRRNAASLGVPHLTLVEGEAPDALARPGTAQRHFCRRRFYRARIDRPVLVGAGAARALGRQRRDAGKPGRPVRRAAPFRRRTGRSVSSPMPTRSAVFAVFAR